MRLRNTVLLLILGVLTACASAQKFMAGSFPSDKHLLIILIGGNSEARSPGGIMKIYGGRDKFDSSYLAAMFRQHGVDPAHIQPYYFSWTGDDEDDKGLLPSTWSWITGGDERIAESMKQLLPSHTSAHQLVIIGWSNGGATAYDLSCGLSDQRPVDLLITLDPVSRTTRPCPGLVARRWLNVYTASGPSDRFKFGNMVAFVGRAWDEDALPSQPSVKSKRLHPANHGDTPHMLSEGIAQEPLFKEWVSQVGR